MVRLLWDVLGAWISKFIVIYNHTTLIKNNARTQLLAVSLLLLNPKRCCISTHWLFLTGKNVYTTVLGPIQYIVSTELEQ